MEQTLNCERHTSPFEGETDWQEVFWHGDRLRWKVRGKKRCYQIDCSHSFFKYFWITLCKGLRKSLWKSNYCRAGRMGRCQWKGLERCPQRTRCTEKGSGGSVYLIPLLSSDCNASYERDVCDIRTSTWKYRRKVSLLFLYYRMLIISCPNVAYAYYSADSEWLSIFFTFREFRGLFRPSSPSTPAASTLPLYGCLDPLLRQPRAGSSLKPAKESNSSMALSPVWCMTRL